MKPINADYLLELRRAGLRPVGSVMVWTDEHEACRDKPLQRDPEYYQAHLYLTPDMKPYNTDFSMLKGLSVRLVANKPCDRTYMFCDAIDAVEPGSFFCVFGGIEPSDERFFHFTEREIA